MSKRNQFTRTKRSDTVVLITAVSVMPLAYTRYKKAKEEGDRLELLETTIRVAAVAVALAQHFRKPRRADVVKSEARHASLEAK